MIIGFIAAVQAACVSMDSEVRKDSIPPAGQTSTTVAGYAVSYAITDTSIADVRIGMTLESVRSLHPTAQFERTEDGDGAQLIGIALAPGATIIAALDEEDAGDTIDYSRRVTYLETFDSAFVARGGVRVGSLVADAERTFGAVKEIVLSEIESRQYVEFARQPATMKFRLDYTGIFPDGSRRSTQFQSGARIFSIAIVRP